jgi:hypothetical protein
MAMDITSISVASRVTVQRQRIAQRRHNVEVVCEGVIHQSSDTAGVFGRLLSSVGNVSVSTMSRGACEHTIARVGGMPPTKLARRAGGSIPNSRVGRGTKIHFTCRKGFPLHVGRGHQPPDILYTLTEHALVRNAEV